MANNERPPMTTPEARCVSCGTTYQYSVDEDNEVEVYNPLRQEWCSDCPKCGGGIFDLEDVGIEEGN